MNCRLACRSFVLVAALSLGCGLQVLAATLRVPGQYPTIQQAIDASHSGDGVLVAPGTYFEGLSIFGKGDLALVSEAGPGKTVIDAGTAEFAICVASSSDMCGAVWAAEAEEAGATREHTTRIAGFTIRNGQSGIFIRHCRAEIEDNVLTGIGRTHQGYSYGVLYAIRTSGAIRRNLVENNDAGIEISRPRKLRIEDNVITRNAATGLFITNPYSVVRRIFLLRNVVSHNTHRGMHILGPLDILAENNLVVDNGPAVDSILFVGADAWGEPQPISGRFVNNTIAGAGSIYWPAGFAGDVTGLEFANNVVYSRGTQPAINCYSYDANPVLHHNDAFSAGSVAVAGYCVDEFEAGKGNLSDDPRFAGGNTWLQWRPAPGSPLIDVISNQAAKGLRRDFLFRPRVIDGGHGPVVDIGAFEFRARP